MTWTLKSYVNDICPGRGALMLAMARPAASSVAYRKPRRVAASRGFELGGPGICAGASQSRPWLC